MSEFSKAQIATILSALDDRPRNPANRAAGLKALAKSADRLGCSVADVLAAAPGLLDGRLSPATFRAALAEQADVSAAPDVSDGVEAAAAEEAPPAADNAAYEDYPTRGTPADQGAWAARQDDREREAAAAAAAPAPAESQPTIRPGTKQALLIDLLRRPEGATVAQIAEATGWQHHTVRGAISGALKKKLGLRVEAIRVTALDADGATVKGRATVYKIAE